MHPTRHSASSSPTATVEGAVCRLDDQGQVQCDFSTPRHSRVANPRPDGKTHGLPPGCSVDLATGRWACPGHPIDGQDARVKRHFQDRAGQRWAVAGDDIVVPALRAVAVGAVNKQLNQAENSMNNQSIARAQQQGVAVGAAIPTTQGPLIPAVSMPPGPGVLPPGFPGMGQAGFPGGVQGCGPAPAVPAELLQQAGSVYQECFVPIGIRFGVDRNGGIYSAISGVPPTVSTTFEYQLFPRNGNFWIFGLKIFTDPNLASFEVVQTGDSDWNHMLGSTDIGTWNTVECFCPVNWGCISITNPLRIRAVNTQPDTGSFLSPVLGSAWGIRRSSVGTCGPFNGAPIPGAY